MRTSVAATAQSRLSPAELFDLLADPRGCVTWHDHPTKDRPQSTDAPPGLALAGAEYWSRGLCGTIAWRARTSVTAAERSRHYATETEIIYEHPRVPRARSSERFILEPKRSRLFRSIRDRGLAGHLPLRLARADICRRGQSASGRAQSSQELSSRHESRGGGGCPIRVHAKLIPIGIYAGLRRR